MALASKAAEHITYSLFHKATKLFYPSLDWTNDSNIAIQKPVCVQKWQRDQQQSVESCL